MFNRRTPCFSTSEAFRPDGILAAFTKMVVCLPGNTGDWGFDEVHWCILAPRASTYVKVVKTMSMSRRQATTTFMYVPKDVQCRMDSFKLFH